MKTGRGPWRSVCPAVAMAMGMLFVPWPEVPGGAQGVDCASPNIPNYVKRQAGCFPAPQPASPGSGPETTSPSPAVPPVTPRYPERPAGAPEATPPPSTPPAAPGSPAPDAPAQAELVPGTYRCSSYNVSGGGGSCRTVPPLVLNPDGSYRYSSTRGRWSVRDGKLLLSGSTLWGPGEILGRDTVRFAYDYRGWRHVVTWICQRCGAAGPKDAEAPTTGGSAPTGSSVGVSLILDFGTAIGGVSGFTIVPAESARSYTHNAPLPEGAVQGLAWETSRTAVALATGRANRLMSGRRYVVFLSWPRETIPVAILDLPPASSDYSTTLPATLDGARVLTQLGQ